MGWVYNGSFWAVTLPPLILQQISFVCQQLYTHTGWEKSLNRSDAAKDSCSHSHVPSNTKQRAFYHENVLTPNTGAVLSGKHLLLHYKVTCQTHACSFDKKKCVLWWNFRHVKITSMLLTHHHKRKLKALFHWFPVHLVWQIRKSHIPRSLWVCKLSLLKTREEQCFLKKCIYRCHCCHPWLSIFYNFFFLS